MKHKFTRFLSSWLCILLLLSCFPVVPAQAEELWPVAPEITSEAAILIEASTGTIIYNKNGFEQYYPASTTKLMTALLAIEQSPLTDIVTCSYDSVHKIGWDSSRIGLVEGEQINMEEALYAILLASANEVSYAVAEHLGGTISNFVFMMNERAKDLGCVNTNFVNPHGLDNPEHYSCAYDLALIAKKLIEYPAFARISGAYYHEIPPTNLNVARPIANTHQILRRKIKCEGVFAGKTGHTSIAGNCLVTCAERDGMTLISVIMKAPDSTVVYDDTIALLNYGFENFAITPMDDSRMDSTNAFPVLFDDAEAMISNVTSLLSVNGTSLVLPVTASYRNLTKKITLTPNDTLSSGENVIGSVAYYYADHYVGAADIIYYSDSDVVVALSPTPTPTPVEEITPDPEATPTAPASGDSPDDNDFRPLIIGGIVAACVLVLGGYLVLIEIPYRKRKKEYYRKRRQG